MGATLHRYATGLRIYAAIATNWLGEGARIDFVPGRGKP